jgi:1-aminocyclopropane-1-carboxylate synthase
VLIGNATSPTKLLGDLTYGSFCGGMQLRTLLARLFNRHLGAHPAITPEQVLCGAGISAIVGNLIQVLCDAGDGVLIPTPYYGGFDADVPLVGAFERNVHE